MTDEEKRQRLVNAKCYYGDKAPFIVNYDGHWTGKDKQVWTYYGKPFNSFDDAYMFYKTAASPKYISKRIGFETYATVNIEVTLQKKKMAIPVFTKSIQQEFDFEF